MKNICIFDLTIVFIYKSKPNRSVNESQSNIHGISNDKYVLRKHWRSFTWNQADSCLFITEHLMHRSLKGETFDVLLPIDRAKFKSCFESQM